LEQQEQNKEVVATQATVIDLSSSMANKQKLELTWIGKENRPRLEPRILLEDDTLSYHAAQRVSETDIFDNKLIFGDNLLALKALEQEFFGRVKCIYIDPPFNTDAAGVPYEDNIEHSIWLSLMRARLEILRGLLCNNGCIFVHLDDEEAAYCKVMLDEVFGRANYVNEIIVQTNKSFGFKSTSGGIFKQANHVLFYAKDKSSFNLNTKYLYIEKGYDSQYKYVFTNNNGPETGWRWSQISDVIARDYKYKDAKTARKELGDKFDNEIAQYAIENADRVFRTASVSGGALKKRTDTIKFSKLNPSQIVRHPNDDMDYMFIGGERVLFYKERLEEIDGVLVPAELLTDVWGDISVEGLAAEGGIDFPKSKKPERLLKRILELATNPGDLVLDSFLGSGTTAAVAHKMGRRWIGIELGEHCHTHCIPRLKKVIDGEDKGGITEAVGWKGGGGFRYYKLAPSLLELDKWGQYVISRKYNPAMLAEAVCKLEGFVYQPSESLYWQQGRSTERDFLYVTTATLTPEQLQQLSDEVGSERTLLVVCSAFSVRTGGYPNLTVKKIPNAVLKRCEWGKDDYSLKVENLPKAPPQQPKTDKHGQQELFAGTAEE
jgi:adenine-specific DNA-methyltransferase